MKMILQVIGLGRNLIIAAAVGLLLGCLFGWMVMGWWVAPLQWKLTPTEQEQYVLMAADSYALNRDADLAKARLRMAGLDDEGIRKMIDSLAPTRSQQEQQNLLALGQGLALGTTGVLPQPTAEATPASTAAKVTSSLNPASLLICGIVALVLTSAVIGLLVVRSRGRREEEGLAPAWQAEAPTGAEAMPSLAATGPPPLGHFVTTYNLGHDTYDESFSIETPMGEFLGECGVGISETIGGGSPAQVTAFEVWLFDKSDIRTVTKVLMSQHAYNDEGLQAKLASKGDPILAEVGKDLVLETSSLRVDLRVIDMEYDGGAAPQDHFVKLTIELAARAIEAGGEPGGMEGIAA